MGRGRQPHWQIPGSDFRLIHTRLAPCCKATIPAGSLVCFACSADLIYEDKHGVWDKARVAAEAAHEKAQATADVKGTGASLVSRLGVLLLRSLRCLGPTYPP